MLQPKRVKFRKSHKGHRRGSAQAGTELNFGDFGLQALDYAPYEAARYGFVYSRINR